MNFKKFTIAIPAVTAIASVMSATVINIMQPKMWLQLPFRFNAGWLLHPGFKKMVSDNWSSNNYLLINVMQLTYSLKDWKREVFRNIFWRKKDVIAQLQKVQHKID
ncbi:hypothetical protein PVK06_022328 [Gossypium arboreum]|uniref:Uncharacterized protein n=1 Tax=Gossypium arboreum TaxID=29729 RepID=A0ABR0P862_GOSAR|nr:hypothetical protein PVK06_022328 [Gossypium arboreum]